MTSIKITEYIGPQEVNTFVGGVVKVTRSGRAYEDSGTGRNTILAPSMDGHADLYISVDRSTLNNHSIRVTSESLRWLANFFNSTADHMDRGLTVPEAAPVYEPVLLIEDEDGDLFYTGDLDAAKALVRKDREPNVKVNGPEQYHVDLLDIYEGAPDDSVAEWGGGRTEEEAWRYALGAYFGPTDNEYDEHALLRALACGNWSGEPPVLPPAVERVRQSNEDDDYDEAYDKAEQREDERQSSHTPGKKDGTSDLDLPRPEETDDDDDGPTYYMTID